MLNGGEDGVMLGFVGNDVPAALHSASGEPEHSEIARFRSAAGENNLVRLGVNQRCDFVARVVDRGPRVASSAMNTGWITEMLTEIWQHRFARGVAKRCGRVIIQVNHSVNPSVSGATFLDRFCTISSSFSS